MAQVGLEGARVRSVRAGQEKRLDHLVRRKRKDESSIVDLVA